jgi:hypothetical protein
MKAQAGLRSNFGKRFTNAFFRRVRFVADMDLSGGTLAAAVVVNAVRDVAADPIEYRLLRFHSGTPFAF